MKKNLRKVMSVFLTVAILLCTMSVLASAKDTYKFIYEKQGENGEYWSVWITGYEGTLPAKLTIPEKISGLPVESIEPMAFMNNTSIKEVVIPETVYWIEDYAFAKCTNLAKITLPGSVGCIDNGAFMNCNKLKTVIYTGYNNDYTYLYVGDTNDALWEAEWDWTHYTLDYGYEYREYSVDYKSEGYLEPAYDVDYSKETVIWTYYGCDCESDTIYLYEDGSYYAAEKGVAYVAYEVINENGDVIFSGEDTITVKYNFFQWIIEYILFGWVWGF